MRRSLRKLISYFLFFLVALNLVAISLSFASAHISPVNSTIPALFGLFFPLWFTLLLLLLIFSIVFRLRFAIILCVIGGIISSPQIGNHLAWGKNVNNENNASLLSFNVRNFDLYNWKDNEKSKSKIFDFIENENANILCIQEFFHSTDPKDKFNTLDSLKKRGSYEYLASSYTFVLRKHHHWGLAIFSKEPIIDQGTVDIGYKGLNGAMYADILLNTDTIRIYNMHLASIRFGEGDYKMLEDIYSNETQKAYYKGRSITRKIRDAFPIRTGQIERILEHIDDSPYPVILCGDLNDTPSSFAYARITDKLLDSFLNAGRGLGSSYNGIIPGLRIDYIFTDNEINPKKFEKHDVNLSDHYPVSLRFKMKGMNN